MRPTTHPPLPGDDFPASFFARIALPPEQITLSFLRKLVPHATTRIPFESMQLHEAVPESVYPPVPSQANPVTTPIDASPPTIWRKIMSSGRGGYCFELNQTLFVALRGLGVRDVVEYGGKVPYARESNGNESEDEGSPWLFATAAHICKPGAIGPLTHRITILGLPSSEGFDTFLLDIGYGSGAPMLPVPLDGRVVGNKYGRWRIVRGLWGNPDPPPELQATGKDWVDNRNNWYDGLGRGWYLQSWLPPNFMGPTDNPEEGWRWTTLYHFMPNAYYPPDFWEFNWYVSTFGEARFVNEEVAFRYLRTTDGGSAGFVRTPAHRKEGKHGILRLRWGPTKELDQIAVELGDSDGPHDEVDEVPGLLGQLARMEDNGLVSIEPAIGSTEAGMETGKLAIEPSSDAAKWELLKLVFGIRPMRDIDREGGQGGGS